MTFEKGTVRKEKQQFSVLFGIWVGKGTPGCSQTKVTMAIVIVKIVWYGTVLNFNFVY